jgi:hypothetical protein
LRRLRKLACVLATLPTRGRVKTEFAACYC